MKFEILQEELVKGLSITLRAVASRAQLPVLSNVLIEAKNEAITLIATDLEVSVSTKVRGKVITPGVATAPAKMLSEFVGSLPSGKVEISLVQESLIITAEGYKSKLQTIAPEEFPKLTSEIPNKGYEIKVGDLGAATTMVAFASARETLRPVLTGILFEEVAGGIKLVATDGFRLSACKIKAQGKGERASYLIPSRAVSEAVKIAEGEVIKIVPLSDTQVAFSSGETLLISQLLDGNFPDYQRIIPKEFETQVSVSRDELMSAIKTVHIFARGNSNMVRWNVSSAGIAMRSESPERGEASATVAAKVEGEGGEIVFNAKFVLEFLQNTQAKTINFAMGDNLKPGAFREESNEDYLYIVMPINA